MSNTASSPEPGSSNQPGKQSGGLRSRQLKQASPLQLAFQYVAATSLVAYGIYGVVVDDLVFPFSWGRYPDRHSEWLHFHGTSAWVMFAAFLIAGVSAVLWHLSRKGPQRRKNNFIIASFAAGVLSVLMIFVTAAGHAHQWW